MTIDDVPGSVQTRLRAVAPLLVVGCLLSPLLLMVQVLADGMTKDVVSLVLVVAIVGTLLVPVLRARSTRFRRGGPAESGERSN